MKPLARASLFIFTGVSRETYPLGWRTTCPLHDELSTATECKGCVCASYYAANGYGHAARVYLPRETALFLDSHPQQTPARWFRKVPKWDDFNRDIAGAGLSKSDEIGGPTLSRHSLRHFASNRMKWAETMSDAERAQQNTHLSPAMTTRVYTDASHPDYGKKIYRMQDLLPVGFTPNKPKRTRKSERNFIDSTGDSADTNPAEFVSPQKPTPFNAAACGTPSELSTPLIAGAALSGVSVGGRASITDQQQRVQGSTPCPRVDEQMHLTVRGDLRTVALVIEALASRQGGWGLVTIIVTIESVPPSH